MHTGQDLSPTAFSHSMSSGKEAVHASLVMVSLCQSGRTSKCAKPCSCLLWPACKGVGCLCCPNEEVQVAVAYNCAFQRQVTEAMTPA